MKEVSPPDTAPVAAYAAAMEARPYAGRLGR